MGLEPGDPRALTEIEEQLARSDPAFAAMFGVLTADPSRARGFVRQPASRPARQLPPQPPRALRAPLAILLAINFALCISVVILTTL